MAHRMRGRYALVLVGSLLMASPGVAQTSTPGVPALDSIAAAYVQYAENDLPRHFTTPALNNLFDNTPADNAITDAGAELGRVLFYDTRLSHNNGTSCASCHTQETGFTDPDQLSTGFEGGLTGRHSMALANARWYASGRFFWDERAATLEDQVLAPIQDAVEMGSDLTELVAELGATMFYPVLFERAFGDSDVTSDRMSRALAQFVRSMVSYQSPYDRALAAGINGNPNFAAVPEIANPALAAQGHGIFGATCAGCHRTDVQVANNTFNTGLDATITDAGASNGRFKTPSLRNIDVRGSFMHDGLFQTLEEVIEFYSSGIQNNPGLGPGLPVGGFNFSAAQKAALLAFLRTLTDNTFLTSDLFSNPFVELAGDFDGSGLVDTADLAVWQAGYATGQYGGADFLKWQRNLGASWQDLQPPVASSLGAVPEPSGMILMLVGSLIALSRRTSRGPPCY